MKKWNLLVVLSLLLLFSGCSTDNSLEFIEENRNEKIDVITKSGTGFTTEVPVEYNFDSSVSYAQRLSFKNSFRQYYDQFIIIYSVEEVSDECPDKDFEIWTVNRQAYLDNIGNANSPPFLPSSSGTLYPKSRGTSGSNTSGSGELDPEIDLWGPIEINKWLKGIATGKKCSDFTFVDDEF